MSLHAVGVTISLSSIDSNQLHALKEKRINVRPIELHESAESGHATQRKDEQHRLQAEVNRAQAELKQINDRQAARLQQTNDEIEDAKKKWETEKQRYIEQAQQEGFATGIEQGKQAGLDQYQQLLTEANDIVTSATNDYYSTIEQSDETILDLAITIAGKIIHQELAEKPDAFISIVHAAIKEIKDKSDIAIYLHPDNYDLVVQQKDEMKRLVDKDIRIAVYIDDDLNAGSCLIEHPSGQIDAGIDTQLKELRETLHEISMENNQ